MKCNIRELAQMSDRPCVIEGRLNYKKVTNGSYRNQAVFKERWFRLVNNYLFYFKLSEIGKFDTKCPAGIFLMENSSIQMEHGQNTPFSFSISFIKSDSTPISQGVIVMEKKLAKTLPNQDLPRDEPEKRHVFAARTEDNVVQWVMKLRECSYEYLRSQLHSLQSKIFSITGKDPLLMVPRNEGACLWAPSVPFSTTPACTVNTTSFSCHLHTNGAFTLERSKSDLQTHKHLVNNTTFYTDKVKDEQPGFSLERSTTSMQFSGSVQNCNNNPAIYTRSAPSPPARTKLSPRSRRNLNPDINVTESSNYLATASIMNDLPLPVPPRRKLSPRPLDVKPDVDISSYQPEASDDLIKF